MDRDMDRNREQEKKKINLPLVSSFSKYTQELEFGHVQVWSQELDQGLLCL